MEHVEDLEPLNFCHEALEELVMKGLISSRTRISCLKLIKLSLRRDPALEENLSRMEVECLNLRELVVTCHGDVS